MPLSAEDIERFVRHVVIPGVGASGQERLKNSLVAVIGTPAGTSTAEDYLRCSGVGLGGRSDHDSADCILVAGLADASAGELERVSTSGKPVVWYELTSAGFTCGLRSADDCSLLVPTAREALPADESAALHAAAACEATSTILALLLGWEPAPTRLEVELA